MCFLIFNVSKSLYPSLRLETENQKRHKFVFCLMGKKKNQNGKIKYKVLYSKVTIDIFHV